MLNRVKLLLLLSNGNFWSVREFKKNILRIGRQIIFTKSTCYGESPLFSPGGGLHFFIFMLDLCVLLSLLELAL